MSATSQETPVARVLALLADVRANDRGWMARCPGHGDSRPSLESLYRNFDDYRAKFEGHARALIASGYLLEEELPALLQLAEKRRGLLE